VISSENYQKLVSTGLDRPHWSLDQGIILRHTQLELAERLIRMFSFAGDVVLDPFSGSGTNAIAAARTGRHSVGYEIIS
jgi:DNA modification methylase